MRAHELLFERNILNTDAIDQYVGKITSEIHNPTAAQWLRQRLPAWLRRSYARISPVTASDLPQLFTQIPEWAERAVENGDAHMALLDQQLTEALSQLADFLSSDQGGQINLSRLSVDDALQRAQEWHAQIYQSSGKVSSGAEAVKPLRAYGNGYRWVEVTAEGLAYEGDHMQHCVGGGGYTEAVRDGTVQIFSLRDAQNRPHVTVEVRNNVIRQVKGKQNAPPVGKYRRPIIDLLSLPLFESVSQREVADLINTGIVNIRGTWSLIEDVAAEMEELPNGHRFMFLREIPSTDNIGYILDKQGNMLCKLDASYSKLNDITVTEGTPYKAIRDDLLHIIDLIGGASYTIRELLYGRFAISIAPTTREMVNASGHLTFIARKGDYTAYAQDDKFKLFIVDKDEHPVIRVDISMHNGRKIILGYSFEGNVRQALPLFFMAARKIQLSDFQTIEDELAQYDYLKVGDKWKPLEEVVANQAPVARTSNGDWYRVEKSLILHKDGLQAQLDLGPSGDTTVVSVNIDLAERAQKHSADIAALFSGGHATLHSRNDDDGFMIAYGVFARLGKYYPIDFDQPVTMVSRHVNTDGEVVNEEKFDDITLQGAIYHGLDWLPDAQSGHLQHRFFPRWFAQGRITIKKNIDRINQSEDFYEDPEGYRRAHNLPAGQPLPEVPSYTVTIEPLGK